MSVFLVATRNRHKTEEIRAILSGPHRWLTLDDFPAAPAVVEDGATFADNARKKAAGLAGWLGGDVRRTRGTMNEGGPCYVLADDSGLEVDALDGAPGVHSARFAALDSGAGGNSPDAANNAKLLRLLAKVPEEKRTARFRCVIALARIAFSGLDGKLLPMAAGFARNDIPVFDGVCEGRIGFEPKGAGGFGYDPLFIPAGHGQTFAELGETVKNGLSHRARALEKLRLHLEKKSAAAR